MCPKSISPTRSAPASMSSSPEQRLEPLPLVSRRLAKKRRQPALEEIDVTSEVSFSDGFSDGSQSDSDYDFSPFEGGGDTSPQSDPPSSDDDNDNMSECTPPCFHWTWWWEDPEELDKE